VKKTKSYLQGGKLGDFIHSLCVCKFNWDLFGHKADLYISQHGESFRKGLDFTYMDLKPILERQEWLNSFSIYNGEHIDVNLSGFRQSRFLYTTNWIEVYFNEYLDGITPPKEFSWINMDKDETLNDTLLINRSINTMSEQTTAIYQSVLNQFPKKSFICFDEVQYDNFTLKDQCEMIKVNTLSEFFTKINGCKLLIGNQSGPMAWATAMNVNRKIELFATVDNVHYIKDKNYYSKFDYFQGDNIYV
jgi:hypothetical protein